MRTIIWFLYFWIYLLLLIPTMKKAQNLMAEGKREELDALLCQKVPTWASALMKLAGVQVQVEGRENIPSQPAVFVSNHQGYFDIPVLLTALDKPHPLVAKESIKKLPLIRQWMELLGCVFIDRDNARQAVTALNTAAQALREQQRSFIIFPEGTRSRGRQVGEFKSGGFRVALKNKAPIVPVAIEGTYQAMEAHHMWIHPAQVKVRILPAVYTQNLTPEEGKTIGEIVRQRIVEAKEEMETVPA